MSNLTTTKLLSTYEKRPPRTRFLTGLLQTPPENFHNSEKVQKDIVRNTEKVATVVTTINAGGNKNEATLFTNKEWLPPVYMEEFGVNSFDTQRRAIGVDNFTDPNFRFNAAQQLMNEARIIEEKIQRAVEFQAAQVFQSAVLSLPDQDGNERYSLNYSPKATHFPQVTTSWSDPAATPLQDLDALANVIRDNGLVDCDRVIMGDAAFNNFINNSLVKERLDNRRFEIGQVAPEVRGSGAVFQGFVWQGNYRYEIWTYNGRYENNAGAKVRYVDPNNVIMMSSTDTVVDLTMGTIPLIVDMDPRVAPFVPNFIGSVDRGMRLSVNAYISTNNKTITMEVGGRPLVIPTGIDTFGTLNTVAP